MDQVFGTSFSFNLNLLTAGSDLGEIKLDRTNAQLVDFKRTKGKATVVSGG